MYSGRSTSRNPQFVPSRPSPLSSTNDTDFNKESRRTSVSSLVSAASDDTTLSEAHSPPNLNTYSGLELQSDSKTVIDSNDDKYVDLTPSSLEASPSLTGLSSTSRSPSPTNISSSSISPASAVTQRSPSPRLQSISNSTRKSMIPPSQNYTKSVPPEFFNKLRSFPLFKHAPKSFHTRIVSKLKLIQHHAQEYIIKKGDESKSMYWILKGSVAVTSTDGESIYAELIPGCFFGEIGILFNRPRTATVVARTKVLLGVLTSESLNLVLPEYPAIERRIRDEAQERLAILDKKSKASLPHMTFAPTIDSAGISYDSGINGPSRRGSVNGAVGSTIVNNTIHGHGPSNYLPIASLMSPSIPSPCIPPINIDRSRSPKNMDEPLTTDTVDFTISIQEFIKSLPIFENLPSEIIHQLALGVEPVRYQPFEYIFRKGDRGSDIYFVIMGEVEVIDHLNSNLNYEKSLARLGYGSYFGEMSFLMLLNNKSDSGSRSANVRTVSNCELIVVRRDKLEELCKTYPFIIEDMRKTAQERTASNSSNYGMDRHSIDYLMNDIDIPNSRISSLDSSSAPSAIKDRRRKAELIEDASSSSSTTTSELKNENKNLHISLPPLNPVVPAINRFRPHHSTHAHHHHHGEFQYLPHTKRLRLASIGGSQKPSKLRSSILPDSLLLRVFEYFKLPDLMKLRPICKKWRQLLYFAPNLFYTLDLTPWNTTIDDKALIAITNFVGSRPRVIDISNCFHVTDEGFSYMINEIGISGQIRILRMRSIWEVSAMAIMDLSVPSVGKHLVEIDLSNCRKVRDNVLERLFGWNDIVIQQTQTNSHGYDVAYDKSVGIGCKMLKKINVGYCKHLTDNIMYHISVHVNETLEILNLTRCTTITDKGFQYWANQSFPNLRDLSLKDCTFLTDSSISAIADSAKNLEHLNLNFCCALSDTAIDLLCMGCPYLKTLDLSFCGSAVSDSSLVKISLHLKNLEKLTIKGCVRVTRAGIDSILSGCSNLYFLDVSQCKNAHIYPGRIPAPKLHVNAHTKSAFVTAGPYQNIIEIVV